MKGLSHAIDKHNESESHTFCALKFRLFGKSNIRTTIDTAERESIEKYNNKVRSNRDIMNRLIDITIFLATQELGFRGHSESGTSSNQGNFRELAKMLSKHDPQLNSFLDEATVFSGLSKTIQNDLIESVSKLVSDKIEKELDSALCFS